MAPQATPTTTQQAFANGGSTSSSTLSPSSIPIATSATTSSSRSVSSSVSSSSSGSASSTSTNKPSGGGGGLSGGGAAGVAIGCLIAGILIASVVFFLFVLPRYRRGRERRGPTGDARSARAQGQSEQKTPMAAGTISIPQDSSAAIIENYLPPPAEDETIKAEFSKLRDKINGHVHSFYHSNPVSDQGAASALMKILGAEGPLQQNAIPQLLANSSTRDAVLRLAVAWIMLSRVGLEADTNSSFLPWQVVSAVHAMPKTAMDNRERMAFLSKWRQMTAYLLPASFAQPTLADNDPRLASVQNAVQLADTVLASFATNPADPERRRNLQEIMKRAVRFAYLLFAHPNFWRFDWQGRGEEGIVVFPGLLQVTTEAGTLLSQPVVFSQREVVAN